MKLALVTAALAALALPAAAQTAPGPTSVPVAAVDATQSGQPILLPQGPVQVSVARTTIPAGGLIPPHRHPFQRYAYVLSGSVRVTNQDTGAVVVLKTGEFGVEARDQWHMGEALKGEPAVLLVIDQAPPGQSNMVRKAP